MLKNYKPLILDQSNLDTHPFYTNGEHFQLHPFKQGSNARKVISEVYTIFVLQCTVFGRKSKHKTDVTV